MQFLAQCLNKFFTEIIDLDFRIRTVHSLYVKVKTLLSLVNLPKFENFEENKFEQLKEKNSNTK